MKSVLLNIAVLVVLVGAWACSRNPYATTNKAYKKQSKTLAKTISTQPEDNWNTDSIKQAPYWVGTTNFNLRKPNFVIIHHTAQNACEQTLKTFTMTKTAVSAHYVICKDGTIHHMLNDYMRAWHGGNAKWGNMVDINSASIGIELDNNGFEPFDSLQIKSLISLLSGFNPIIALRIIGYDVKDNRAAIQSFKRHFLQDTTKKLNAMDSLVLYNLQKKYL
jgi:N-acetylmuramoyl-L-alanine amidase